jgi:hypothetical protein
MKLTPENNPVSEVPLRRRRSPWNYRVCLEAMSGIEELYQGQSGTNAKIVYGSCILTTRFLAGTATIRIAAMDGKREIGGWITKVDKGHTVVNHERYGDPLKQSGH